MKLSPKNRRAPRRKELLVLAAAAAAGLMLIPLLPERAIDERAIDFASVPFRPKTPTDSLFAYPQPGRRLPHFEIIIRPEFLRALDAAVPKNVKFQKVRYKKVPVEYLALDGRPVQGSKTARYRGFGNLHWGFQQKSIKIETENDHRIRGHRTLNLTALATDPLMFEVWAAELLHRSGGAASRVGLATVDLNGKYDGLRQIVENIDMDLLESQGLPKGALYRERTHIKLGRKFLWKDEIRDWWKKNSLKNGDWSDLNSLNDAVRASVIGNSDQFLRHVDIPHYVNYAAVVAIMGSYHVNDHNIPIYRPRGSAKFIPVGYDFGWPGETYGLKHPSIQVPYMGMNWLSQLFWSDARLRRAIHRRAAAILERFPDMLKWYDAALDAAEPYVARDLREGASLDNHPAVKTTSQWRAIAPTREMLRRRLVTMRRSYLAPRARLRPNWRLEKRTQGVIEGAGAYAVRFEGGSTCPESAVLKLRYHDRDWEEAGRCEGGRFSGKEIIVERNDVSRPFDGDTMYMTRNSIGAILLDIDNPAGIALSRLYTRSLQTDRTIPTTEDWPLFIDNGNPGKLPPGFEFIALHEQAKHAYDAQNGNLRIEEARPSPYHWERTGPVLCWGSEREGACHEIVRGYPAPPPEEKADEGQEERYSLDLSMLGSCKRLTLPPGRWRITASGRLSKDCTLVFSPETEIRFSPGSYLILAGPVEFPKTGWIRFSAEHEDWGGIVIDGGGRPVLVRNAEFSHTNEFSHGGTRRTAALTVINASKTTILKSVFRQTSGDDALNILGGESLISGNIFINTRDAIDIDGGRRHTIQGNLFRGVADDAIDLGGVESSEIFNNAVFGAGDKAVSIGEGSTAAIGANLFYGGNVGIGVKENSRAVLDAPLIVGNEIGVHLYRKLDPRARPGRVEGAARLFNNRIPLRIEDGPSPAVLSADAQSVREEARALMRECVLCRVDPELQSHVR